MEQYKFFDPILNEIKIKRANNRWIIIDDEITQELCTKVVYHLDKLVAMDEKLGTKEKITLEIASCGGGIYSGICVLNKIYELRNKGYIIEGISHYAMSMGFQILQACSIRKCYRLSRLMFHQPSTYCYGDLESIERDVDETLYLWEMMKSLVKERTLLTDDMMEQWKKERRDKYFNFEELTKYNIVDEII